jgi:hypothetical protein
MQTQTHFLITAALGQLGRRRTAFPVHMPALLAGSVLPNVPFAPLTLLYSAYYRTMDFHPPQRWSAISFPAELELLFRQPVQLLGGRLRCRCRAPHQECVERS